MFRWLYDLATNMFLAGGPCEVSANPITQGVVLLSRHPDPRTERYDGAGGIRPATVQEVADYDATQKTAQTAAEFDAEKLVKALAIWTAQKLNIPLPQAKQEILTIYRGL
jgi:hypothetical protein